MPVERGPRNVARLSALLAIIAWPGPADAKTETVVRISAGDHPYSGRIVLDAPGLAHTVTRDGDVMSIRFAGDPALGTLPPVPRNVLAFRAVPGGLALTVAAGAKINDTRAGAQVIVDVGDGIAPIGRKPGGNTRIAAADSPTREVPAQSPPAPLAARQPPGMKPETPVRVKATPAPLPEPAPLAARAPAVSRVPAAAKSSPATPPRAIPPAETPPPAKPPPAKSPPAKSDPAKPPAGAPLPAMPAVVTPDASHPVTLTAVPDPPPPPVARPPGPPPASSGDPGVPPPAAITAQEPHPPPSQAWPVTREPLPSGPIGLLASRLRPAAGLTGSALQIPFAEPVGAAMFTRGADTYVVFDERRPIDLAALRDDPVFASASVTVHPAATVIRLTLPAGQSAILTRVPAGWRISTTAAAPRPAALTPAPDKGALVFTADQPGQVVALIDPVTGGTLLAGTQRKPGQAVLAERRTAEFILPVTGQGVVVEPLSDAIALRVTQTGFVLIGPDSGLAVSPAQPAAEALLEAARLTRNYGFPAQSTDTLARRARTQAAAAATAPPLARGPKRRALAESWIGLGMAAEALTLLRIAAKDDPKEAASAETMGLAAIAALLSGRPKDAADLADPRLSGSDETALWRAIQLAMTDETSPAAASLFATSAPLLFTYPDELRRRILPLALETMVLGGAVDQAERLLAQREKDPALAYARALLREARGDHEAALALLREVTDSRSPLDHARASVRAVELQLRTERIDAKAAADALDKRLYAWRGDRFDLALRLRIAALRRQTGAWRQAFALLRAARGDFPGQTVEIDRQLKEAFASLPQDSQIDMMPPTELIGLLEENAELMADGPDGEPMRIRLAEKLMALDLPKRADAVLTKLMRAAPIGPAKAGFGATLATLRLREGDAASAMVALSESSSADMGEAVRERRALIRARVEAARGDTKSAMETLSGLTTAEASEARASLLERAKDWPAARDALAALAARAIPDSGTLNEDQSRIALRLAAAASHAGDDATLAGLRETLSPRLGTGKTADMIRLLTAAPVRGTADLGRAQAETALAKAVTAGMGAAKPAAKPP